MITTYGHALVIFYGYQTASTKDETHRRRQGTEVGATVSVAGNMHLSMAKRAFLSNYHNKQAFIYLQDGEVRYTNAACRE